MNACSARRFRTGNHGFTLVELLIVITLISVLAALLLPTLQNGLEQGRRIVCGNNHKQNYLAWNLYVTDFNDRFPAYYSGADSSQLLFWQLPTGSPMRLWAKDYANIPDWTGEPMTTHNVPSNSNSIAFCPNFRYAPTYGYNYSSYTYQAVGKFNGGWAQLTGTTDTYKFVGTTKMTCLAEGSPRTLVGKFPYQVIGEIGADHDGAGGYGTTADGASVWIDDPLYSCGSMYDIGQTWSSKGMTQQFQVRNGLGIGLRIDTYWTNISIWGTFAAPLPESYQATIFRSAGYVWPPSAVKP